MDGITRMEWVLATLYIICALLGTGYAIVVSPYGAVTAMAWVCCLIQLAAKVEWRKAAERRSGGQV